MKKNISKVIIIGGGIAGAIAAYVCVKSNINTLWFAPKSEVEGAIQIPPNSIRALFGTDGTKNAVHGSDSNESASRELNFMFGNQVVAVQNNINYEK